MSLSYPQHYGWNFPNKILIDVPAAHDFSDHQKAVRDLPRFYLMLVENFDIVGYEVIYINAVGVN